jgi:LPS-assembly protein
MALSKSPVKADSKDSSKSKSIGLEYLKIVACNLFVICYLLFGICPLFAQEAKEPITVNGDNVEYSTDNKEVSAQGNVFIIYKNSKLTCEKIVVNTETKEAAATGNIRLDDPKGVIEGESIKYNLQNKTGVINNAEFRFSPFFGKSKELNRVSEQEFIAQRGYISSCSYDFPHYRMKAKKIDFFQNDKVIMRNLTFSAGQYRQVPFVYLPVYRHSLKDPFMHVQVMPGHRKDWGYYMLSGWRYNLTDSVKGRLYLDYRDKLGVAQGFGANYTGQKFGKGDFKYYYSQERSKDFEEGQPAEFQRYLIRWRHKWDIDNKTNFISEYHRITDSKRALLGSNYNILKDYFPREYEKDTQPLSYNLLHRSFGYSSLDFLVEKRVNRWDAQTEKLPEIKYSLPSSQIYETPFYFENNSSFSSLNKKAPVPAPAADDINVNKFDTKNKVSLPAKVAFIQVTPFVASQQTFYDKDINGASLLGAPRTIFSAGADASTKFYRVFNLKSDFLGLNINDLRHVITPTVGYAYQHAPTIQSSKLKLEDALNVSNAALLGLSIKLQTK